MKTTSRTSGLSKQSRMVKIIPLIIAALFGCNKEKLDLVTKNGVNPDCDRINSTNAASVINSALFLPTLTFDGKDYFDTGERNFPQAFSYNTTQDANGDGNVNVEDNLENLIRYSIGNNLTGTGRTGLTGRGPDDQRPAVYFHYALAGNYQVYEYWIYYADNDWINDHEHDWEKYFVYVQNNSPQYIKLSSHTSFDSYGWSNFPKDGTHPQIGVDGGAHAMKSSVEDGVRIRYNGQITQNNGTLLSGNNQVIPWIIYSDDNNVSGAITYLQSPNTFYYGDPVYSTNSNEFGDPRQSPWMRSEWNNPPLP